MSIAFYWFVAVVVLVLIECFSMGLTTIWFAAGALVAAIASFLGANIAVQIILFLVVSIVMLVFTRPWALRFLNNRTIKTNVESLIGKNAIVTEEIDNLKAQGQNMVQGVNWTARCVNDQVTIPKDSRVEIKQIVGVKCIVEAVKE